MSKAEKLASLLNASGLLDSDDIATNAITAPKIASGAIDFDAIGTGAITAEKLNVGQLGGRRNLIINGAVKVAQRSILKPGITTPGYYTADRFRTGISGLGTWTQTVENDGPDGFSKSLKMECTTADASPAAGDFVGLEYKIESQDLQHLKKGTSSAESVTASFWVKSNKTGTYILEVTDYDNNRHISKTYTVNVSGTWEYKTITFEGDTTGVLTDDNTTGLGFFFWLGSGTNWGSGTLQTSWGATSNTDRAVGNVNLADTIGNYFQITGVQLELGDTATPFEYRSYGEELALCERYYETGLMFVQSSTHTNGATLGTSSIFATRKRTTPTVGLTVTSSSGLTSGPNTQGITEKTVGMNAVFNAAPGAFTFVHFKAEAEL